MEQRPIHHVCNRQINIPKLWERIVLLFVELQFIEGPAAKVWYKVFWDRLYIYKTEYKKQLEWKRPWDGGVHTPWLN